MIEYRSEEEMEIELNSLSTENYIEYTGCCIRKLEAMISEISVENNLKVYEYKNLIDKSMHLDSFLSKFSIDNGLTAKIHKQKCKYKRAREYFLELTDLLNRPAAKIAKIHSLFSQNSLKKPKII